MESKGMFDKYMKDDGDAEAHAEPKEDAAPEGMHDKHMEMMCQMIHMMTEMLGMFSAMLESTPSKRKAPEPKADEYE